MFDILFVKTFFLVGLMLIITTICTRINKEYETTAEAVFTILGTFVFLFAITYFSHIFPLNIFLVSCFAGVVGWSLGPTITALGRDWKFRKLLKKKGIKTKKDKKDKKDIIIYYKEDEKGQIQLIPNKEIQDLRSDLEKKISRSGDPYLKEWQNIVFQAMLGTTIAVIATASIAFLSSISFSFLGVFLFIALLILILMTVLNYIFFKSRYLSLLKAYFGVVSFVLYLLYDFGRLRDLMAEGTTSWSAAIDIAVNLYLDIINLFLYLLEILASD